jgi:YD repeat-containing protein
MFVVLVLLGVSLTAGATAAKRERTPIEIQSNAPHAVEQRQKLREHQEREAARRATPEAKSERERSRHVHGNATGSEARELAKRAFKDELLSDVWEELPLRAGERIKSYSGRFSLIVERDGEETDAVVESNVPLRVENEDGSLEPVELAFEDRGDHLRPKLPISPVKFFRDARRGVEFERSGLTFAPADIEPQVSSAGEVVSDRIFFANVYRDTDFWAMPTPEGFRTFHQLRSANSPERLVFDLDVPAGGEARMASDGSNRVEILTADGRQAVIIDPPAAIDAGRHHVPVEPRLDGHRLTMTVPHRAGDYMYPILVDPDFREGFNWIDKDGEHYDNATQWAPEQPWGGFYGGFVPDGYKTMRRGLLIGTWNNHPYFDGQYGNYHFRPHRTGIFIPRFEAQVSMEHGGGINTYLAIYTSYPNNSWWEWGYWFSNHWVTRCVRSSDCSWDVGEEFQAAYFGQIARINGNTGYGSASVMHRAYVWLRDRHAPANNLTIGTPTTRPWARTDSVDPSGSATDGNGLGMQNVTIWGPTGPLTNAVHCEGSSYSMCPQSLEPAAGSVDAGTTEGWRSIGSTVSDKIGHQVNKDLGWFRIDRSAPQVTTPADSPSASESDGDIVSKAGGWVKDGTYSVKPKSTDAWSGVKKQELQMEVKDWDPEASVILRDEFNRTVSGGWGDAHVGGPWRPMRGPASNFSVDGSQALIQLPARDWHQIVAPNTFKSQLDATMRIDYRGAPPATGHVYGAFRLKLQPNDASEMRVGLVLNHDGKLRFRSNTGNGGNTLVNEQDSGLTYVPGDRLKLRVRLTGSTQIEAKAWKDGTAEPSTWPVNVSTTVAPQAPGIVGVHAYNDSQAARSIGFDDLRVVGTESIGFRRKDYWEHADCDTTVAKQCPTTFDGHRFKWKTDGHAEGEHRFKVVAGDPLGHLGESAVVSAKLDRTRPELKTSGSLRDAAGGGIGPGDYVVRVEASDPRSGVQRADLSIDDEQPRAEHIAERTGSCDACPTDTEFKVETSELAPGLHRFTVRTVDFAGNVTTESWQATYVAGTGDDLPYRFNEHLSESGTTIKVNLASGNLVVRERDLQDATLGATRYYNSALARRSMSVGRGWSIDLGHEVRLRQGPGGAIIMNGPSQQVVRFNPNLDGTFTATSPAAIELARNPDGTFVATDVASGRRMAFPSASSSVTEDFDDSGARATVSRNASGLISATTDADGTTQTFSSEGDRLTTVTDADGRVVAEYQYDARGRLDRATVEAVPSIYEYDADDRLVSITRSTGERFEFAYRTADPASRIASVTRMGADGATLERTTYTYGDGQTTVVGSTGAGVYQHDLNAQVYAPDARGPLVYEPYGYTSGEETAEGAYVSGAGGAIIDVIADDSESGVQRAAIENARGEVLSQHSTQCQLPAAPAALVPVCPPRLRASATVNAADLPEGATPLRTRATDGAGNSASTNLYTLLVDRTPPPQATPAEVIDFDAPTRMATIGWESAGEDPRLPTGEPGSGYDQSRFRYRRAGGAWTAWTATTQDNSFGMVEVDAGDVVEVEVQLVDAVGNTSNATVTTVTIAQPAAEESLEFGTVPPGHGTITYTLHLFAEGVTDADDHTVPASSAQVVFEAADGQQAVRATDSDGVAKLSGVAPGTYRVFPRDSAESAETVVVPDQAPDPNAGSSAAAQKTITIAGYEATPEEKKFCLRHLLFCRQFRKDAQRAAFYTAVNFTEPEARSEGTKMNAFKHVLWVSMMVRSIYHSDLLDDDDVRYAYDFARAHESESRKGDIDNRRNSKMDFHNNGIGYDTGRAHARKHNDKWLCNRARGYVRGGGLFKFRRDSTRWRRAPGKRRLAWIRKYHRATGREVFFRDQNFCFKLP